MNRNVLLQGLFVAIFCHSLLGRADHLPQEGQKYALPAQSPPLTIQNYNIQGPVTLTHGRTPAIEAGELKAGQVQHGPAVPHANTPYYRPHEPAYVITAYKAELHHPEQLPTGSATNKASIRPYYLVPYYNNPVHGAPYQQPVGTYAHATYPHVPVYHTGQPFYVQGALNQPLNHPIVYQHQAQPIVNAPQITSQSAGTTSSIAGVVSESTDAKMQTTVFDESKAYHVKNEQPIPKSTEEIDESANQNNRSIFMELMVNPDQVEKQKVSPTVKPAEQDSQTSQEFHSADAVYVKFVESLSVTPASEQSASQTELPETFEVTTIGSTVSVSGPEYSSTDANEEVEEKTMRDPETSFDAAVTTVEPEMELVAATESELENSTTADLDEEVEFTTSSHGSAYEVVTTVEPEVELAATTEALVIYYAETETTEVTEEPSVEEHITTTQTTAEDDTGVPVTEANYKASEVATERSVDSVLAKEFANSEQQVADVDSQQKEIKHITLDITKKYPVPIFYRDISKEIKQKNQQEVAAIDVSSENTYVAPHQDTAHVAPEQELKQENLAAEQQIVHISTNKQTDDIVQEQQITYVNKPHLEVVAEQKYHAALENQTAPATEQLKTDIVTEHVTLANSQEEASNAARSPNPLPRYPVPLIYREHIDQGAVNPVDQIVSLIYLKRKEETKEMDVIPEAQADSEIHRIEPALMTTHQSLDKHTTTAPEHTPSSDSSHQTLLEVSSMSPETQTTTTSATERTYEATLRTTEETKIEVSTEPAGTYSTTEASSMHQEKADTTSKQTVEQPEKLEQKNEELLPPPKAPIRSSTRRRTYTTTTSTTTTTTPLPPGKRVRTRPDYNKYRRTLISKAEAAVAEQEKGVESDNNEKSPQISARNQRLHQIITKRPLASTEIREFKQSRASNRNLKPVTASYTRTELPTETEWLPNTRESSDYRRGRYPVSADSVEEDDYMTEDSSEYDVDYAESVNKVRKVHQTMAKNDAPCILDELKQALLHGEEHHHLPPGVILDHERNRAILPDGFALYYIEEPEADHRR